MFTGKTDHIVFSCSNIEATRSFYEETLGVTPNTVMERYVTYSLGQFTLCFKEVSDPQDVSSAVVHIGIDFSLRSEIDFLFKKIIDSTYPNKPERIIGGQGEGPYRFYVKDPAGYKIEFESWEDCSN